MSLDPARAAVRGAVRRSLADLSGTVLVACSGGADSLALLAATVFESRDQPVTVVGVVVDHALQDDSAALTQRVVAQMVALGADETASIRVTVDPGPAGVEAGARQARYAALAQLAQHFGAELVLLGHTLDDQAETVLLGLARGSGGRSLMGMRRSFREDDEDPRSTLFLRPLLDLTRAQTEAACRADGIEWWTDPHNSDPRFTRARVRHTVLPVLERELGPGVAQALARTADLLREDVTSLDERAEHLYREVLVGDGLETSALDGLDPATKHRVIRIACLDAGAISSELTREHVLAVAEIVHRARDGRQIQLPGHVTAYRDGAVLRFRRTGPAEA
ncbi:tRNA lysidine(34) synthetase TilS [Nocardioides pocheonensis]|uniref:tRNA(Ile)-lysidine synthase n=1 Tax=Nocardioides pocheonensis TaxID=661485 RepID=A0A3N0GWD5_9ACTN|nr:tRNA lysidine(34) synthetase TilS [Nocardioides pocheonensis]RNM16751.1 tRNA lysidine(34) synthetase TilS [Nocardioides pocheonensis]